MVRVCARAGHLHGKRDESEVGPSNLESGHKVLAAAALKGTADLHKRGNNVEKPWDIWVFSGEAKLI